MGENNSGRTRHLVSVCQNEESFDSSRPRGANFKGIPRDRELGLSYLRTAAELGFGPAIEALDQYDVRDENKTD